MNCLSHPLSYRLNYGRRTIMKASEIVIQKLKEAGGEVWITLLNGDEVRVTIAGRDYFVADKLPYQNVDWSIFDIVVDFLKKQPRGRAVKGGCRSSKVGENKCGKGTVMHAIAAEYYGKEEGESSYDPLFVIAAILDWAGIARNERGYMELINESIW